jgi:hypothetical protein
LYGISTPHSQEYRPFSCGVRIGSILLHFKQIACIGFLLGGQPIKRVSKQ